MKVPELDTVNQTGHLPSQTHSPARRGWGQLADSDENNDGKAPRA